MKIKTNKIAKKRLKVTGRGKLMHRPVDQDHFNAKESGQKRRSKRHKKEVKLNNIERFLPYNKNI